METFVTEYRNALIALVLGITLITWGWKKYASYSRWLREAKKTRAKVLAIERVIISGEDTVEEYDQPTFEYHTTGEIKVAKAHQLFEKNMLKVGDTHTVHYNHNTPGRVHSEMTDDLDLLWAFFIAFMGGGFLFLSLIMFLV